jgi:hypothetical protein
VTTKDTSGNNLSAPWSISGQESFSGVGENGSTRDVGSYTIAPGDLSGYTRPSNSIQSLTEDAAITFNLVYTAIPPVVQVGDIRVRSNVYTGWSISGPENFRGDGGPADYVHVNKPVGSYSIVGDAITCKTLTYTGGAGPKTLANGGEITFTLNYADIPGCGGGGPACIPDGSCTAPTPACEQTTSGVNNCGTACTKVGPIPCPTEPPNCGEIPGNKASGWTQTVSPSTTTVYTNTPMTFNVSVKNCGTTTWTVAGGYKLGTQNALNNTTWGGRVDVPYSVAPRGTAEFSISRNAPSTPGTYYFQRDMLISGVAHFDDIGPTTVITVIDNPCVPNAGNACTGATSAPNACGMTNPGTAGTYSCAGVCSGAPGTTPPDSSCPAPTATITADAPSINYGASTTIRWSSTNASSCTVSAPGWTGTSGAESTGALYSNTTYTVTCPGSYSSSATASVTVSVYPELTCSPASQTAYIDQTTNFTTSGGNGNYSWTGGGTPASQMYSALTTFSTVYSTSGAKTVNVNSNDANKTCSVSVLNRPVSCGNPASCASPTIIPPDDGGGAGGAGGVAGAINDYCGTPSLSVNWGYYDYGTPPSSQSAHQVQIAKKTGGSYDWTYRDTGKVSIASLQKTYTVSMAVGDASSVILDFGGTYAARVRVWNSADIPSSWSTASDDFSTAPHPYPQVTLTSNKSRPAKNTAVTFSATGTDIFSTPKTGTELLTFGDGTQSSQAFYTGAFLHTYTTEGTKDITFKVTDNNGYACILSRPQMITVQKEIPEWIEVAPR